MGQDAAVRLALELVCRTRADALLAGLVPVKGVILTLHRVRPATQAAFQPNGILEVTPEFLDATLVTAKELGFRFVSLDQVPAKLVRDSGEKFACVTLDDGYRDNRQHAQAVFARHCVPYTIFVPEHFADGTGQLWWVELEAAIAARDTIDAPSGDLVSCRTAEEKGAAFRTIYWQLRSLDEDVARTYTRRVCLEAGVDAAAICPDLIMTWDELRELAQDPLASFGAHTSSHYALAKLPADRMRAEMAASKTRLERELGRPCLHFSYPYGDDGSAGPREFDMAARLGFSTAVTTRKSLLFTEHGAEPTALPRCSLNGDYQDQRYVRALLSGVPFRLWQLGRDAMSLVRSKVRGDRSVAGRRVA